MRKHNVALRVSLPAALVATSLAWACKDSPSEVAEVHEADRVQISAVVDHIHTGLTTTLTALPICAHGKILEMAVTWSSSDESVATVSPDGVVSGLTVGDVDITASADNASGSVALGVEASVVSVGLEPASATIYIGESVTLVPTLLDETGASLEREITWASDDGAVASVDEDGVVTGVDAGSVLITAASEGVEGSAEVGVLAPVAFLSVTPDAGTLKPGETLQLAATLTDEHGGVLERPVAWISDDEAVATVNETGLVTAVGVGSARVTASSEGVSAFADISVIPHVHHITIDPAEMTVSLGGTASMSATVYDEDGNVLARPVTWSSSNPGVADVNDSGLVTAFSVGTATISASAGGVSGTASVTVQVPVHHVVVTDPGMEPIEVGLTLQLEAIVYDVDGNVLDRTVTWSSSDPNIADVDDNGLVTGTGRGTAVITATSEGKFASAEVRVVGEDTGEGGNNLSYPVVFAEGIGLGAAKVSDEFGDPVYLNTGLRPTEAEEIVVDALPFFHEGNAPDYGIYYMQQASNVWQAEWRDGTLLGGSERSVEAAWGDNLTHQTWNTHSMIRVEVVLSDRDVGTLQGFNMSYLYGSGPDEMQGTDGTLGDFVPTVFAITPRLVISKLDADGVEVIEEVFNGAIWEGTASEGPGAFSAEVNVSGKVIYGFNLFIRNIELETPDVHKFGWWRLRFELDPEGQIGSEWIARNLRIDVVTGEGDPEVIYQPERDPDGWATWLDIWVDKATH